MIIRVCYLVGLHTLMYALYVLQVRTAGPENDRLSLKTLLSLLLGSKNSRLESVTSSLRVKLATTEDSKRHHYVYTVHSPKLPRPLPVNLPHTEKSKLMSGQNIVSV